jgi:hypothetical protein
MKQFNETTKALAKAWLSQGKQKDFTLTDFRFGKQLAFVQDPSPFATAVCSVRAGKTVGCAADLVHTALGRSGIVCLYITLNRLSAKGIIWPDLLKIVREYKLGAKVNESELSITFNNDSKIYISGAKDKSEIEKFRGLALALCYIDECQALGVTSKSLWTKLSLNDSLTTLAVYDLLELPAQSRLDTSMTVVNQVAGRTTIGQCSTTPGSQSNQGSPMNKSYKENLTEKASQETTQASNVNVLDDGRLIQMPWCLDTTIN